MDKSQEFVSLPRELEAAVDSDLQSGGADVVF